MLSDLTDLSDADINQQDSKSFSCSHTTGKCSVIRTNVGGVETPEEKLWVSSYWTQKNGFQSPVIDGSGLLL